MSIIDDLADAPDDSADTPAFSFKDLLAEALEHKADGEKLKTSRKAIKEGALISGPERLQMLADIKRIENAREWLPKASVAMFQIQHCTGCENYNTLFTGLFQRQGNRHQRDTDRWIAATEAENYGLVKEVKTNEVDIPMCGFCLQDWGFPAEQLGIVFDEEPAEDDAETEVEADAGDEPTAEDLATADFEAAEDEVAYPSLDPDFLDSQLPVTTTTQEFQNAVC
jgi:hypothetical protein